MGGFPGSMKRQDWFHTVQGEGEGSQRLILHSPNLVNLCIDFYDGEQQRGRMYHSYSSDVISFSSLFEALKKMNSFYDKLQFPQASTELRSFRADWRKNKRMLEYKRKDRKEMESFDKVTEHRGRDATFIIRVQFRQNSSWQGEITWLDKQKKERFRSALELVRLIDSAMEETEEGIKS